jgi:hypothetical protein
LRNALEPVLADFGGAHYPSQVIRLENGNTCLDTPYQSHTVENNGSVSLIESPFGRKTQYSTDGAYTDIILDRKIRIRDTHHLMSYQSGTASNFRLVWFVISLLYDHLDYSTGRLDTRMIITREIGITHTRLGILYPSCTGSKICVMFLVVSPYRMITSTIQLANFVTAYRRPIE